MKNKFLIIFIIGFLIIGPALFINEISAQGSGLTNVKYPIEELGACKDEADCKLFCDKSENIEKCLDFAKNNSLMSAEEIDTAKKFTAAKNTPGKCKTKDACEEYCNDMSHINECVAFAEKNNILPAKDLEEAKKIQAAMAKGIKPPPCKNKKACDTYCEDPEHMEECITFATQAGFMEGKELEDAQKMLAALKKGVKPLPCQGKDACDKFCSNPDNMEACITFASEAGMMSEQEKADSQKMIQALKKGVKPPQCKGKEECDAYCQQAEHTEECINFSVAAGMMNEEDAIMARKTGGKGPGGCKGKEECDTFCKNNQQVCFEFGKANGLIPQDQLQQIEKGNQMFRETLQKASPELLECIKNAIGTDLAKGLMDGTMSAPDGTGPKMKDCFDKFPVMNEDFRKFDQAGPGGCKDKEECDAYCKDHQEECQKSSQQNTPPQQNPSPQNNFQPGPGQENPGGQIMRQQAGPGGCKTPEECRAYCEANLDECKNFGATQNQNQQPMQNPRPREDMRPPENQILPNCQDGNCPPGTQPGQMPSGDFRPPEGQTQPTDGIMQQNQQMPQQEQQLQQPLNENPPPPPPPAEGSPETTGFIINTDSLVGSLMQAFFKFITQH